MSSQFTNHVLEKVATALGRSEAPITPPIPPELNESIIRLVHTNIGLSPLFCDRAAKNKMGVTTCRAEELTEKLMEFLKANECIRIALPVSELLDSLEICDALKKSGFDVRQWNEMTLDEIYDFDCGVTDVTYAVAETGSLVIRSSAGHGRSMSLVPPIHVAIVEPKNLVGDLMDVFDKIATDNESGGISFITGPSKTSDIEMNLVVGVHGPCKVQVFVLE
jgi:L-lactate dehydrogenase complex protein LldG